MEELNNYKEMFLIIYNRGLHFDSDSNDWVSAFEGTCDSKIENAFNWLSKDVDVEDNVRYLESTFKSINTIASTYSKFTGASVINLLKRKYIYK